MASRSILFLFLALVSRAFSQLSPDYYAKECPNALPVIKGVVEAAVKKEARMGASLLRLHFHDCFVNGCDASVLLDDAPNIDSEKNAVQNKGSLRGFEVVDQIKAEVDKACGRPVVSCADILAVAARDSVVALGGPTYNVELGRRDSTTATKRAAQTSLPLQFTDFPVLLNNFRSVGLDVKDLVALSGAHTLGFAQCSSYRSRLYSPGDAPSIDPTYARQLRQSCPPVGDRVHLSPFDQTPDKFDSNYFNGLIKKRGLVHSDQAIYSGNPSSFDLDFLTNSLKNGILRADQAAGLADSLVRLYASNLSAFSADFATSMLKMGSLKPLTRNQGQIRLDCKRVNQ